MVIYRQKQSGLLDYTNTGYCTPGTVCTEYLQTLSIGVGFNCCPGMEGAITVEGPGGGGGPARQYSVHATVAGPDFLLSSC